MVVILFLLQFVVGLLIFWLDYKDSMSLKQSLKKECFLLYLHELWHLLKKRQVCLILINHTNQCQRDSLSLWLQNQNYGMWYMKPHDTKPPEISGAPFPLALYDGSLSDILFFLKILEWGTESTPLLMLPQMCSSHRNVITTSVGVTNRAPTDEKIIYLQNIKAREVQEMVFNRV